MNAAKGISRVIAAKQPASTSSAPITSGRRRPKRSARAPATGAAKTAPIMLIDMKSDVASSETAKRSPTSPRRIGTGSVTGSMIASASRPIHARRAFERSLGSGASLVGCNALPRSEAASRRPADPVSRPPPPLRDPASGRGPDRTVRSGAGRAE